MTEDTNTTSPQQESSMLDSARERLGDAGSAIRDRVDGLVDAAKQNPGTAAAIAAGAAAAVGAAAYGVTKLREGSDNGNSTGKNAGSKK